MAGTTSAGQLLAGRYRIEGPLGAGGMGTVWAARDERLHREVAVKEVVPPAALSAHEREVLEARTLREARAAARIASPHAVTVFDVLDEDDRPWIVMERLSGLTLADVLRERGQLDARVVARLGLQLLDALSAAHRADVLHRDVKPSNVLVDEDGNAVLGDFGIATLDGDPGLTTTGTLIGSPAFIAPERARGGPASPATDLFSLGATLYAAAEGHAPFERGGQLPTLTAVVTEPVPPPRVGGPLGEALTGLLAKDPEQRLSAEQARTLLQAAARAESPTAVLAPVAPARPAPEPARGPSPDDARTQRLEVPPAARQEDGVPPAAVAPVAAAPAAASAAAAAAAADLAGAGDGRAPVDARVPAEPSPGRSAGRRTGLLAALAAVVLLVVGAGVALHGRGGGTSGATGPVSPRTSAAPQSHPSRPTPTTSSASAAPAPTTTSPRASAAPTTSASASASASSGVPAGYALRSGPGGFAVAVPAGWTTSANGQTVTYRDPQSGQMLLVDQTDTPKSDPAADWRNQEQARRSSYPGYSRIRIEPVDYRGWKAADWEFTYDGSNGPLHVLNRGFVTSPDQAYSLFALAPQSQWAQAKQAFDVAAASFRPGS
ncbi:MAG: serine/threonine-protein kinase [Motilibacteraceae bacterium]